MVYSKGMFFCSGAIGKFKIVSLLSMVASMTVIKEFVNYLNVLILMIIIFKLLIICWGKYMVKLRV